MKYIISFFLLISLLTLTPNPLNHVDIDLRKPQEKPTLIPLEPNISEEEIILSRYTVEQKVGQLFIFGFDGTVFSSQNREFLYDKNIGGVLLLGKNIDTENKLKDLIINIQSNKKIPLFISIDQEGDPVSRLKWNEILTKPQKEIDTVKDAYSTARNRGLILKDFGINMNLAPVVEYITDTNSFMYNRVFRGSKTDVIRKSISSILGYSYVGVISVPKHFPGHSNNSPDSHNFLPSVDITIDQWDEYIEPFSEIIKEIDVDAIMVGHIKFPNIDDYPATLSKEIISNKLKNELNYDGLVISDDMEMGALDNLDTYPQLAKKALEAGVDILIFSKYSSKDPQIQRNVYDYILQEVKNGKLNIDEKFLKILRIKMKYNILFN